MSADLEHVNYPHHPGRLYDCAACESECFCDPCAGCRQRLSACCTQCVFCALLAELPDNPNPATKGAL